ncbi:MAG: hypothetical protein JSR97_06075 [Verrucomicrobia bacterium]|nr:hypothetical protein [Verrucomicrobiota bacterium]
MPVQNYSGQTFVAFLDISGFKELMKDDRKALEALKRLYQSGYDALREANGVEGFFVSDSGILFVRTGTPHERLVKILSVIKQINRQMLRRDYMLTTSIAYGNFDYHDKLEFDGIEKNPIYGYAYVQAFLDNETGSPRLQPGQCRLVTRNLPDNIDFMNGDFNLLKQKGNDNNHRYYYWNVNQPNEIENFEETYNDSYKLKYTGMLKALKRNND